MAPAASDTEPWADLLCRRVAERSSRLGGLSVSPDGRIALCAGSRVSVLHAMTAAVPESSPGVGLRDVLDMSTREARSMRAPLVGHVVVTDCPIEAAVSSSWAPTPDATVLLLAPPLQRFSPIICIDGITALAPDRHWHALPVILPERNKGNGSSNSQALPSSEERPSAVLNLPLRPPTEVAPGNRSRRVARKKRSRKADDSDHALSAEEKTQTALPDVAERNLDIDVTPTLASKKVYKEETRSTVHPSVLRNADVGSETESNDSILCTAFVRVCATNSKGSVVLDVDHVAKSAQFLLLGTKTGASIQRWRGASTPLGPKLKLSGFWTASLDTNDAVDISTAALSKIAIGGPFGEILILGATWSPGEHDADDLNIHNLWRAPKGLFYGPVSCFSFGIYERGSGDVYVAMTVGNSVAVAKIVNALPASGSLSPSEVIVRVQENAHTQLTSSVNWLPDSTILSTSMDGSMLRWRIGWGENQHPCELVSTLQTSSEDMTSVMAARRSGSGLVVVVVRSRPRNTGEIGEPAVHIKRKYGSSARSSLLSILAYSGSLTGSYEANLQSCLQSAVTRLLDSVVHFDAIVSLWDVQLWLLSEESRLPLAATILHQHLAQLLSMADSEALPSVQNRVRKVALCVANLLSVVEEKSYGKGSEMQSVQTNLRTILLCYSFTQSLRKFVAEADRKFAARIPSEHRESLEAMKSFVRCHCSGVSRELEVTVQKICQRLEYLFASPPTLALSVCQVCDPSLQVQLTADEDQSEYFFCADGDCFLRCVLSALPCTDAVPLVCTGCQSRARCRAVDCLEASDDDEEACDARSLLCPLCNCPFLPCPWN